jgi:hypothetical protein
MIDDLFGRKIFDFYKISYSALTKL